MNPVFVNDLRKSLIRRKPVLAVAIWAAAILVLMFTVTGLVPQFGSWQLRQYSIWRFPDLLLPILAPVFAAGAFAKEHEQRTWQDVLLTRLRGREILAGKFFACFFPTFVALTALFPALALLLIIQGAEWAMNPGPWMIVWAVRAALTVTFYAAVTLVVSYHSPNPRTALAISYGTLAAYAMFNYVAYIFFVEPLVNPTTSRTGFFMGGSEDDLQRFVLSPVDWLVLLQALFLSVGLLAYLGARLRQRTA